MLDDSFTLFQWLARKTLHHIICANQLSSTMKLIIVKLDVKEKATAVLSGLPFSYQYCKVALGAVENEGPLFTFEFIQN